MSERPVMLFSTYASAWKHVTPYLTGMNVVLGSSRAVHAADFAVVGHANGGREAQRRAIDDGARVMVLMGCGILPGREHDLETLDIPVLLLWGEDDIVHPVETAFRMNELIHRSTLALVPGCGNALPEEAPDTVGPLIADFLRSQWLGLAHGHDHGSIIVDIGRPERAPGGRP